MLSLLQWSGGWCGAQPEPFQGQRRLAFQQAATIPESSLLLVALSFNKHIMHDAAAAAQDCCQNSAKATACAGVPLQGRPCR